VCAAISMISAVESGGPAAMRLAEEQLHHHEGLALRRRAEIEDADHVRVADGRGDARLAQEALREVLGRLPLGRVDVLHGDRPVQLDLLGAPYVGHAALADALGEAVLSLQDVADLRHVRASSSVHERHEPGPRFPRDAVRS
jgi:ribosome-associated protein YbcJ (S4-like RNA binding protein)